MQSVLAVFCGAGLGAVLRWWLGLTLNAVFHHVPLGTLVANVGGGYLMGLAMGWIAHAPGLPVEVRLLVTTGFLGGLTTFSAFSAEVVTLVTRQQSGWAALVVALHVIGSLAFTGLGVLTVHWLRPGGV